VLRANQRWAPVPDNDPAGARRLMTSFYRLLAAAEPDPAFEPMRAAELEVEWWRVHRAHQGGEEGVGPLFGALTDLYSHCYDADPRRGPPRCRAARRGDGRLRRLGRRRL
jgi:hypothetical protein